MGCRANSEKGDIYMTEKATAAKTALAPVPVKVFEPLNLFDQFDQIYDSIAKRAFELFDVNGRTFGHQVEDWFKAESELLHPVHVNVTETDGALTVYAEVPGFDAKDLDIRVEPRRVAISGKRETSEEQTKGKTVYQEQCSNQILRVIELPAEVETEKAAATLKNGMIEVQIPKSSKAIGTRVEVKAA